MLDHPSTEAGKRVGQAHRVFVFLLTLSLATPLGLVSNAAAQSEPAQVSKADRRRAEKLFKEGAEHFYASDYAKALVKFKAAYAAAPNAMIVYNISLTHARLGNVEDALDAALTAKKGRLPTKARTQNDARIVGLRRILAGRQLAEDTLEHQARAEAADQRRDADTSSSDGSSDDDQVDPVTPPARDSFGTVGWTGVGLSVLGVGSLAAAGLMEMSLDADLDAYRQAAANRDEARYRQLQTDISSKQSLGQAFLFGGAGLVAVGSGLLLYELLDAPEGRPAVTFDATLDAEGAVIGFGIAY